MATGIGYGTTTGATGKSSLQMQTESTFTNAGWDFQGETTNGTNDIWGINIVNNSEYPFLSWQGYVAAIMPNGSGTSSDPYQIATLDNLYWMSQDSASLSKYFKQTADIDASSSSGWSGRGFPKFVFLFSGTYDGAGHTISGIYINDTTDKYGGDGLFMYIWAGTVKNLGLINVNMYAHNGSGAFAGLLEGGTIENCYSTGIVKGDSAVGGIVGFSAANNDSTPPSLPPLIPVKITGCYSTATVEATEYGAGGIVGQTYNGSGDSTWIEITNCYSTSGIVSSPIGAGGIVGYLDRAILNTSYSTGDVYCPFDAGGIAGISTTHSTISNCFFKGYFNFGAGLDDGGIVGANAGEIKNCYAVFSYYLTPGVDEATNHIGGLVGLNDNGTSNNSFWDTTYWGLTYSALGTGLTTTQMKTSSTFLNAGWDSSIWYRDNSYNSGYPYLAWQNPGGAPLPVELTSFTAAINENKVELNWKTATEVNNYGFEIQRRNTPIQFPSREGKEQSDRGVWKKVGFVKGSGTSTSPITYSFVDNNPLHGKTEYRLKQENYDGTFKYSSIISVNVLPVKFVLYQNYPNPFNPTTTIKYSLAKAEHVTLKVYDELGREVKTLVDGNKEAGRYSVDFNGLGLASGVYYYRIKAGNFNEVKKLILLK